MAKAPKFGDESNETTQTVKVLDVDASELIVRLSEETVALKQQVTQLATILQDVLQRTATLEADVKLQVPTAPILPPEIRQGITPADLYMATYQSAITGLSASNPTLLTKNTKSQTRGESLIQAALSMADAAVQALNSRLSPTDSSL